MFLESRTIGSEAGKSSGRTIHTKYWTEGPPPRRMYAHRPSCGCERRLKSAARGGDLVAGCDRVLELPLDGCHPATRTLIRNAAKDLRRGVEVSLAALEADAPGVEQAAVARQAIDTLIRGAVASLREVSSDLDDPSEHRDLKNYHDASATTGTGPPKTKRYRPTTEPPPGHSMAIWFLNDLHDERLRDDYARAMLRLLEQGGFASTIQDGRLLEVPEAVSADNVAGVVAAIRGCSAAMGGCLETRPAPPWAGFVIAADLGIARLQELVEVAPTHGGRRPADVHHLTAIARYQMTQRLFASVHGLHTVVSALSIADAIQFDKASRLREASIGGRFQVTMQR